MPPTQRNYTYTVTTTANTANATRQQQLNWVDAVTVNVPKRDQDSREVLEARTAELQGIMAPDSTDSTVIFTPEIVDWLEKTVLESFHLQDTNRPVDQETLGYWYGFRYIRREALAQAETAARDEQSWNYLMTPERSARREHPFIRPVYHTYDPHAGGTEDYQLMRFANEIEQGLGVWNLRANDVVVGIGPFSVQVLYERFLRQRQQTQPELPQDTRGLNQVAQGAEQLRDQTAELTLELNDWAEMLRRAQAAIREMPDEPPTIPPAAQMRLVDAVPEPPQDVEQYADRYRLLHMFENLRYWLLELYEVYDDASIYQLQLQLAAPGFRDYSRDHLKVLRNTVIHETTRAGMTLMMQPWSVELCRTLHLICKMLQAVEEVTGIRQLMATAGKSSHHDDVIAEFVRAPQWSTEGQADRNRAAEYLLSVTRPTFQENATFAVAKMVRQVLHGEWTVDRCHYVQVLSLYLWNAGKLGYIEQLMLSCGLDWAFRRDGITQASIEMWVDGPIWSNEIRVIPPIRQEQE
jgi:hypothetical protein